MAEIISSFEKVYQDLNCQEPSNDLETPWDIARECTSWEALPRHFADWIQAQEGLKLGGEPIRNRNMLVTASHLLHRNSKGADGPLDSSNSSIIDLAICVALQYIKEITRTTGRLMQDSTIPGSPEQVIERACFTCKKLALDDAFPRFFKEIPGTYVIKVNEKSSCGRPDCKGQNAALTPVNPRQKYARLRTRQLKASARARSETSRIATLLRSGSDLKDCPTEVLVQCPNKECVHQRTYCRRWTINNPPRFVQPKLVCSVCKYSKAYFRAVNAEIPTITEAALYDVLNRFKGVGCNLMEFPKVPEVIFCTELSYEERFELFKKAKYSSYVIKVAKKVPRKRKHDLT